MVGAIVIAAGCGERLAWGSDLSPNADRLFSEGLKLAREGDCARAKEKFAQSYAADPAPGTLINWALCEEKLGRVATAFALLRLADERLPAGHPRISDVKKESAALRERVPYLRLHPIRSLPAGTIVAKDGMQVELSSLEQKLPTDPGDHVIEVRAPGYEARRYEVALSEGRTVDLAFEPGAPLATATPSRAEADGSSGHRVVGWAIGGVGVASLGVSAVTGLLAMSRWNAVQNDCVIDAKACRTEQGQEAAAAGRSLATASTVTFAVGAVGVAAGAFILLHDRRPTATGGSGTLVAVTAGTQGLQVSGAF